MKKSLLGLLVITLTIVGCQNYDDQFDELNDKILSLSQSISELDGIRTEVTALGTKLDQLASTSASASDLATVMAEVAALTESMAAIKAATDYGSEEVDDLEAEIDEIKASLNELLAQASIIQQDIVIMSIAQLEYVENLMGLDPAEDNTFVADESREYIVKGNVTVDAKFVEEAAIATRLNNVLARIASVIADGSGVTLDSGTSATKGTALTMTSFGFVDGMVTLKGANAISVDALAALTETLTLMQGGAIAFPSLNQVGNVRLSAATTVTSIDFSNVTTGKTISTSPGVLSDPALTGDVNLGKLDLPADVSLDAATSITAGGAPDGVTISASKATAINLMDTVPFEVTGAISITAKGDINMNAKSLTSTLTVVSTHGAISLLDLTSAGATTLSASETIHAGITSNASGTTASGSQVHLASLESNAGGLTITAATAVDLSKLKTNTNTATINTVKTLSLPALTHVASPVVANAVTDFDAAALVTASSTINLANTGADVLIKNLTATTTLLDFATMKTLTLTEQGDNLDFSAAASMTTLNYTGKLLYSDAMDQQTNQVTITNSALTSLNIGDGYIGTLHVNGAGIEDLTTAGKIVNTEVANNVALKEISFGHDHLSGERAATVLVSNNDKVQTLDLSTINKVKSVNVSGNASLTALTMAGYSPAAEPGAAINVTINANKLAASYDTAVAGSETTPYSDASLSDATGLLCSVSEFILFYHGQADRTVTPTLSLNIAEVTNDAATPVTATLSATLTGDTDAQNGIDGVNGNADDETDGGAINSIKEMEAIIDSCS